MCLLSNGMMATEDGTQLLVSWLPENEKIIRFAKDEEGVLLWSIKREDGIDGTKVTFTARKMDSSSVFNAIRHSQSSLSLIRMIFMRHL